MLTTELISKHTQPGPRYTSYPTAPEWKPLAPEAYKKALQKFGNSQKTLSLYIHIPFCNTMCYYCGCNVVIRKSKPEVGNEYLDYLEKEIRLVQSQMGKKSVLKQFHLGGGTPNFLSSDQLNRLMDIIHLHFDLDPEAEIAIEIDPRTVEPSQLQTLKQRGFNRISMGIQDFSAEVQAAINRIQPYDQVTALMTQLRALEFSSINMDLIYGLPHQTLSSFKETIEQVISLKPDRIALYSFAHIPWLKSHQKLIDPETLPLGKDKLDIFLQARGQFLDNGYDAIAMDHFALNTDELASAFKKGTLYRNFMGYTLKPADEYVGLGVTAIGLIEGTFSQNTPDLKTYYARLDENTLPTHKGLELSEDDLKRQWVIQELMCHFRVNKKQFETRFLVPFDTYFADETSHLNRCESEGLLTQSTEQITATELGRFFVRNIAMGFDWYLRQAEAHKRFSSTI
jgi:oxygen-independent coproporphyrinogen-3 oxidase